MKAISDIEIAQVHGGGILHTIDEAYQYAKEAAREFWRGLKEGGGLEES